VQGKDANADEWRSPEDAARIRDEAFRRLMKMPPKPQEEMKLGKPRKRAATLGGEDVSNVGTSSGGDLSRR